MKFFIVLCSLGITVSAADWKPTTVEEFNQIREDCMTELGVPANFAESIRKYEYPDDPAVRCHIRCVALKEEIFDDTNGYNIDRVIAQVATADYVANREDLAKCLRSNDQNSDKCTWAYRDFKCSLDNKYIPPPTIN